MMRGAVAVAALGAVLSLLSLSAARADDKPNFVIFFVDDWGWGDLGINCLTAAEVPGANASMIDKSTSCFPHGKSITPRMDSIATEGMRFTDFHAGAAVCAPSRAALQTGRLGARNGVITNFGPGSLGGLPTGEITIPQLLKRKDYATAAIGKWHLGMHPGFHPLDRGYDHYLGLPESIDYGCTDTEMGAPDVGCPHWQIDRCPRNWHDYNPNWDSKVCHPGPINPWNYSLPLVRDHEIVQQPVDADGSRTGVHLSQAYANFAVEFIHNATAHHKPYFLYVAWSHIHVPLVHSRKFTNTTGKGIMGDTLAELDDAVGQILDAIDGESTLVFLTGDNGPPEDQCDWGGSKGPFLGQWQKTGQNGGSAGKMTSWEAGHRVPGAARWVGKIQSGMVNHGLFSTLDYLPTLAALAGVDTPKDRVIDGLDMSPVLLGRSGAGSNGHNVLFFSVGGEAYNVTASAGNEQQHQQPQQQQQQGLSVVSDADLNPTALFEAVRVGSIKAMYRVGYGQQCCRAPDGAPNTPFNKTCSPGGALGPTPAWLEQPLLFDLASDVAEAFPLDPGSEAYHQAHAKVNAALDAMAKNLASDLRHKANYKVDMHTKLCCNQTNVVCRCHELP